MPSGVLVDQDGRVRFADDLATADCQWAAGTCGTAPIVDMGAYEYVPVVPCDYNHDGDVDLDDFATFEACVSGPTVPYRDGCAKADFDGDNDVDQVDFATFQRCYSGAGKAGDPNCAK